MSSLTPDKLWLMGGTPLNNEVWSLESVSTVSRRAPLTRSTYANYTYALEWKQYPDVSVSSPYIPICVGSKQFLMSDAML